MDHEHHHNHTEVEATPKEYAKFAGVILGIIAVAIVGANLWGGLTIANFLRMFMGTFFLVFAIFKLLDLHGFATSYAGYDIIAKQWFGYGTIYPFIEIGLAAGSFFNAPYTNWLVLFFMAIGSIGVFKELMRGSKIKCACLGTYIKLPLTTVSLIEDVVMGVMALLMILQIF
jgi:hypothetical protein